MAQIILRLGISRIDPEYIDGTEAQNNPLDSDTEVMWTDPVSGGAVSPPRS
jgi:hypothetical protein